MANKVKQWGKSVIWLFLKIPVNNHVNKKVSSGALYIHTILYTYIYTLHIHTIFMPRLFIRVSKKTTVYLHIKIGGRLYCEKLAVATYGYFYFCCKHNFVDPY